MKQQIQHCFLWYSAGSNPQESFLCASRDVFQARLHRMYADIARGASEAAGPALLTAAVGEIGNKRQWLKICPGSYQWRERAGVAVCLRRRLGYFGRFG